jgi:ribosomal protein L9
MGAYYSSGERGCPSLQQIVEKFSQAGAITPPKTVSGGYETKANSVGHFVVYRKPDGITRYLSKGGEERTSCSRNNLDGTGGYFRTTSDAEEAIAAHKNRVGTDWAKMSREIEVRSFTIESKTLGEGAPPILLKRLDKYDIAKCLNKNGFSQVEPSHVYLPKPITELGYYKVLLQFPNSSEIYASVWVVPV